LYQGTDLPNRLDGTAIVIVDEYVNKDLLMQGVYRMRQFETTQSVIFAVPGPSWDIMSSNLQLSASPDPTPADLFTHAKDCVQGNDEKNMLYASVFHRKTAFVKYSRRLKRDQAYNLWRAKHNNIYEDLKKAQGTAGFEEFAKEYECTDFSPCAAGVSDEDDFDLLRLN
jgi:hypothetical protein